MRGLLSRLRRVLHGNEAATAYRREHRAVDAALNAEPIDPRFRAAMHALAKGAERSLRIGASVHDPTLAVHLPVKLLVGSGHGLVTGGSGGGKSYLMGLLIRALLQLRARDGSLPRVWVDDRKGDLIRLARSVIADLVDELPAPAADELLSSLVVIEPFSTRALVPLNVLSPEPNLDFEVQAFEVTSLVNRLGGAPLGIRQEGFLHQAVLLGILTRRSLPALAVLLDDPVQLENAARSCEHAGVRSFFAGKRLAMDGLEGVRARLGRLLRVPSTRAMLGADDSVSFRQLLNSNTVLIDLGSVPAGCEDLAHWLAGLITLKMTRATFSRSPQESTRRVVVFTDEWQEGLVGMPDAAEHYSRVLAMARSFGLTHVLISQTLANAAQVSATLPKVVATNTVLQVIFRADADTAAALKHVLPVTGRMRRPAGLPWEDLPKSPFLSASEEQAALVAQVTTLPQRTFLMWNRLAPYPAQLVKSDDLVLRERSFADARVTRILEQGTLARPIEELAPRPSEDPFRPVVTPPRTGRRPRRL